MKSGGGGTIKLSISTGLLLLTLELDTSGDIGRLCFVVVEVVECCDCTTVTCLVRTVCEREIC